MAKLNLSTNKSKNSTPKKTSIGGKPSMIKLSSMNKRKKNSYKAYRGQGR